MYLNLANRCQTECTMRLKKKIDYVRHMPRHSEHHHQQHSRFLSIESLLHSYPIMKLTYHLPSIVLIVSVLTNLARGVEDELLRQDHTRRSTRNVQLPLPNGDTAVPRGKYDIFTNCLLLFELLSIIGKGDARNPPSGVYYG
jgi:hypothetical protein